MFIYENIYEKDFDADVDIFDILMFSMRTLKILLSKRHINQAIIYMLCI